MMSCNINKINQFRTFNKLKSIYRFNSVGNNRKESSAEHSWSCLMLADFFLSHMPNSKINRLKVYELLMYHDVVEIEAGDVPLHPDYESARNNKSKIEEKAKDKLLTQLPSPLNKKFKQLFEEFEEQKTIEAKFAKAIDSLDAEIHELDYKDDWKGWTKQFLIDKKEKYVKEFPLLYDAFKTILKYLEQNNYLEK